MMKKVIIFFLLTVLMLLTGCAKEPLPVDTADSIYDYNNNAVSMSDITNSTKPAVLNFWTTWCPYCLEEMPDFNEVYADYKDKVNFYMIDVNGNGNDDMNEAKTYVESEGFDFPVYFDTDLTATMKYSVSAFPTSVIIDSDGNVVYNNAGAMSKEDLISILESITK